MDQLVDRYATGKAWWAKKRWHYNKGLVMAGISAFILFAIVSSFLIAPYDQEFEILCFKA